MYLSTPRLIIRDYEKKDAPGLFRLLSTPVVHRFADEVVTTGAEAEAEVVSRREAGWRYAVCLAETGDFIGDLFADPEPPDTYSLGWNFLPEAGGQGLRHRGGRRFDGPPVPKGGPADVCLH